MKAFHVPNLLSMPALLFGFLLTLSVSAVSCVGARFDQTALDNVQMLSDKLPALMEKAVKPYADSEAEAQSLLDKIEAARAHSAASKRNKDVAEQWRILRDDMVAPFVKRWKEKNKLDKDFIAEAAKQVKSALASITRAEQAKRQ